jgi:L-arabinonolactonase
MRLTRMNAPRCHGGENPLWDPGQQLLYYIDNSGKKIHRLDPGKGETRSWSMPLVITTLVLREGGGAVVTLSDGIYFFDFDSEALERVAALANPPTYVYNDGKVDRKGRLIVGASTKKFDNPQPDGGLFRFDPDKHVVRLHGDVHYSNGPCFSPDDKTLYFADSWLKTIYAYDYDVNAGSIRNQRPFINTTAFDGLPDGATVDRDGRLWVAIYGGGVVVAYRPDRAVDQVVTIPAKLPSSVMFGGEKLDQLYVTTIIANGDDGSKEEGAGYLYRVDGLDAVGIPESFFAG